MKRSLLPHTGQQYSDDNGWVIELSGVDYENQQVVAKTIQYKNYDGPLALLMDGDSLKYKVLSFSQLRTKGVRRIKT